MYISEIIDNNKKSIEFNTYIGKFQLSENANIYNAIKLKYQNFSNDCEKECQYLWDNYQNDGDKFENLRVDLENLLMKGMTCVKDDLISCRVLDQDETSIFDKSKSLHLLDPFYDSFETYNQKIYAVLNELQQKKDDREMRKENRGRWEGATISSGNQGVVETYVDNAKFQLEIGAMNFLEGLGHTAFNAIGNSISEKNAQKKISAILNDDVNKEMLCAGIKDAIKNLHLVLIVFLDKDKEWIPPTEEKIQKSSRLLKNSDNDIINNLDRNKLIIEAWNLNPYNVDIYANLIYKDISQSFQITEIARYFGVDLLNSKDEIAIKLLDKMDLSSEELAWDAQKKLNEIYGFLELTNKEELKSYQKLKNIIERFDLEYRTVDSFECTTREKADESKIELPLIQEFMSVVQAPSKESLLDYETDLLKKKEVFCQNFSSEVAEKYKNVIDSYLADFDTLFCSVGLLGGKVDRKTAGINRAIKYAKTMDLSTESMESASARLRKYFPLVGINEIDAQKAFSIIKKRIGKVNRTSTSPNIAGELGDTVQQTLFVKCPNCGNRVAKGKKFCSKCGTQILQVNETKEGKKNAKCVVCGKIVSYETKFCPECGAKIVYEQERKCRKCGIKLKYSAKFCPQCGTKVEE